MKNNWNMVLVVAVLFIILGSLAYIFKETKEENISTKESKNTKEEINNNEIENTPDIKEEPKENKEEQTKTFTNHEGEEIKITGEKVVSATGFAGSSNHVFYLKDGSLYYKNITSGTEELIATGVKDLYLDRVEVTAELSDSGEIIKENNYITYK